MENLAFPYLITVYQVSCYFPCSTHTGDTTPSYDWWTRRGAASAADDDDVDPDVAPRVDADRLPRILAMRSSCSYDTQKESKKGRRGDGARSEERRDARHTVAVVVSRRLT